jgi:hypothetical protein
MIVNSSSVFCTDCHSSIYSKFYLHLKYIFIRRAHFVGSVQTWHLANAMWVIAPCTRYSKYRMCVSININLVHNHKRLHTYITPSCTAAKIYFHLPIDRSRVDLNPMWWDMNYRWLFRLYFHLGSGFPCVA